jgi:hypothetical protein
VRSKATLSFALLTAACAGTSGLTGGHEGDTAVDATVSSDASPEAASDAGGDGSSMPGYRETVLGDGPVAYWRLGDPVGATTIKDETGNGHDGTVVGSAVTLGAPGSLAGDRDTCASFGPKSYIAIGDMFGFEGGAPFSLEVWLKPTEIDTWRPVLAKGDYLGYRGGYALLTNTVGAKSIVYVTETYTDAGANEKHYTEPLSPGIWTYLVFTFDGSVATFYLNGVLTGTQSISPAFTPSPQPFTIAGPDDGPHGGLSYDGLLDEVAVYGKVLAGDVVRRHFRVGTGLGP